MLVFDVGALSDLFYFHLVILFYPNSSSFSGYGKIRARSPSSQVLKHFQSCLIGFFSSASSPSLLIPQYFPLHFFFFPPRYFLGPIGFIRRSKSLIIRHSLRFLPLFWSLCLTPFPDPSSFSALPIPTGSSPKPPESAASLPPPLLPPHGF